MSGGAAALATAAAKPERIVVGLNSGTAMDAVDALVARFRGFGPGARVETLAFRMTPFSPELRERLLRAPDISARDVCALNRELGLLFAAAARGAVDAAGLGIEAVDVVGSHGQTICHQPPAEGRPGATLQIGDLDVIAAATGRPVIGDFRAADVAAGGQGAPLMPYLDLALFRDAPGTLALNLGGTTCLTWLPGGADGVRSFDVGPCNTALDHLAAEVSGGAARFDDGGRLALSGTVRPELIERLLAHPFFAEPPPKTTGREVFGRPYVRDLLAHAGVPALDVLATHTALVGESVGLAVDAWIPGGRRAVRQVAAGGGGVRNAAVMAGIGRAFAPAPVRSVADSGVDPDAKEALLFAWLANDRLAGLPTNLPSVTGARRPVALGKLAGW